MPKIAILITYNDVLFIFCPPFRDSNINYMPYARKIL